MLELEINTLAQTKYPQSAQLQQIPGVGPITALYFVLKIEAGSLALPGFIAKARNA